MNVAINHHGYKATLSWKEAHNGWRAAWWLALGSNRPIPVGRLAVRADRRVRRGRLAKKLAARAGTRRADGLSRAVAYVSDKYIGEPPPADHSRIWGRYACGDCGAKNVRLWRDYQTVLIAQTLRCRTCCEKHEGKTFSDGSDQLGWSVPAVPTSDGSTFWGYSSVPQAAVDWWYALPTGAQS